MSAQRAVACPSAFRALTVQSETGFGPWPGGSSPSKTLDQDWTDVLNFKETWTDQFGPAKMWD